MVETNFRLVADWVNGRSSPRLIILNLLASIKDLLENNWEVRLLHVYRESNCVADLLAAEAIEFERGLRVLATALVGLQRALCVDNDGIA